MAITIEQSPSTFSPSGNPLDFVLSSTNSTQDNFSIVVELYVNASLHSTHQVFMQTGLGRINVQEVLASQVSSNLLDSGQFGRDEADTYKTYYIKAYEKYGTPPVIVGGAVTSSTFYAFNGSLRHIDWLTFDYTDYNLSTANDKLFLSSFPRSETYFCGLQESMFVSMINTNYNAVTLNVELFDVSDVSIVSDSKQVVANGRLVLTDVSPQTIITEMAGISSANFDDCYYYKVKYSEATYSSEEFKIYIDNECTQFNAKRIHWLNKYGAWESYSFIQYNEESTTVKRTEYQSQKGAFGSSSYDYGKRYGQVKSGVVTSNDSIKLNSDWISESKYQWLVQSLYESPKVYMEETLGEFELVIPQTNSFRKKTRFKDKLIQEEANFKRTYTYISQLN